MFGPCRKMGVGGCKEYLLISQRTSLFFKAARSEKGKMRLGLAMADIYQILPHFCLPQQWISGRGSLHGTSWNNMLGWAAGQAVLCRNAPRQGPLQRPRALPLSAAICRGAGEARQRHLPLLPGSAALPPARRGAPHTAAGQRRGHGKTPHTHFLSVTKKSINQKQSRIFNLLGV